LVAGSFGRRPNPAFPREDAIRKATEHARQGAPELDLQDARIVSATAELTTLGEVDRRQGTQHPSGYGPGRDQQTPAWWISVVGQFRYRGIRAPSQASGEGSPPLYEADERVFLYDARTGDLIGGSMGPAHVITPAPGPSAG
jgi:hypothetical protein